MPLAKVPLVTANVMRVFSSPVTGSKMIRFSVSLSDGPYVSVLAVAVV